MSESASKLFSLGKILGGLILCLLISAGIYLISTVFIFAAWHCPAGDCQTAAWVNIAIFLILSSPFLVFVIGAYLCRNAVYSLTENKILRFSVLAIFACFPVLLVAGFVVYAINSTN